MRALRLALRLARSPTGIARLMLIMVGSAVAAVALLGMAAVPGVVDRQRERLDQQHLVRSEFGQAPSFYAHQTDQLWRGRFLTRLIVADAGRGAPPPNWLNVWPAPGQAVLSPALQAAVDSDPSLRAQFPQQVIGHIAGGALASPDQLLGVVGVTSDELSIGAAIDFRELGYYQDFGALRIGRDGGKLGPDPRVIRLLMLGLTLFVFVPTMLLVASSARLSWRTTERRLAALRIVGMTPRAVRLVSAFEVGATSGVGAAFGGLLWTACKPQTSGLALGAVQWWARDLSTPWATVATVIVGVVALAVGASQAGLRRLGGDPLRARAEHRDLPVSRYRLLPISLGIGLLVAAFVSTGLGPTSAWLLLYAAGNLSIVLGLVVALPLCARFAARLLKRVARGPRSHLAAARLAHEPRTVSRIVASLLVITFVTAIGLGMAAVLQIAVESTQHTRADGRQVLLVNTTPLPATTFRSMKGVVNLVPLRPTNLGQGWFIAADANCDEVLIVSSRVDGECLRGHVHPSSSPTNEAASRYRGESRGNDLDLLVEWPDGSSGPMPADAVVPPEIPAQRLQPIKWIIELERSTATDDFRSQLLHVVPGATVTGVESADRGRLISTYNSLLVAGMGAGLVLTLLSTLAAVADRARERQRSASQLTALGVPTSLIRQIETIAIAAPLVVGMVIAIAASLLSVATYMRADAELPALPTSTLAWTLGIVATTVTAIAGTTFVLSGPTRGQIRTRQE